MREQVFPVEIHLDMIIGLRLTSRPANMKGLRYPERFTYLAMYNIEMKESSCTSLIFANVLLSSTPLGTELLVLCDTPTRSWLKLGTSTDLPLDECRSKWPVDLKVKFSESFLSRAKQYLDDSYGGGYLQAVRDLQDWLCSNPAVS